MNYVVYHLHTTLSNCTTNIDSVTWFDQYVQKAVSLGMKGIACTEHGNIFSHYAKRKAANDAGLKYIHGVEAYITFHPDEKIKDNYHTVLLAKNKEGFFELNRLVSRSFNRDDNHFYYTPRIFFDDLAATSENIIVTSACLGGALNSSNDEDVSRFLDFMRQNRKRCYFEIQHHLDFDQIEYNKKLARWSSIFGIPLIAGTDTHALNPTHLKGRTKLQQGKGIHFENEDAWAMEFLSYDELCEYYRKQGSLPEHVWLDAIEQTNKLLEMVEDYELDNSIKYPNVFQNPDEQLRKVVYNYLDSHPYAIARHGRDAVVEVIEEELDAFRVTGQSCYMLLLDHLCKWEREHGERIGYGRGSVNGSMVAYLMGATAMDSMKFNLNFFRFCNPGRVSLADVDIDHSDEDRQKTKSFLLDEHMGIDGINSAEIITYNTIKIKGAVRDIARAYNLPLKEVGEICEEIGDDGSVPDSLRKKYAELFEYVDIVSGTVVSYGSHPCGVLVTDHDADAEIGTCTSSGSAYRITALDMKQLDALNYVKWDVLGLDSIDLINRTCDIAGIERITPDTIPLDDEEVWKSIRNDNTCIFQFESDQAAAYLRKLMSDQNIAKMKARDPNFSMIRLFTFASALLRPSCASFRDDVAEGKVYDNGCAEINAMLSGEAGYVAYQESIMRFLSEFAGYTQAESDTVRRAIAKKKGTEKLLPEIKARFMDYAPKHTSLTTEQAERVIDDFLVVIQNASDYGFSENHSFPYAITGYAIGYLRYHYPLAFTAAALNIYADNLEKSGKIIQYATRHGVRVLPPRWGKSRAHYMPDTADNTVSKGIASIKTLNETVPEELYERAQVHKSEWFCETLIDIKEHTSLRSDQLDALIDIDFFAAYGNIPTLRNIRDAVEFFKWGEAKTVKKTKVGIFEQFVIPHANGLTKAGKEAASWTLTDVMAILRAYEEYQRQLDIPDISLSDKIAILENRFGYVDLTTGRDIDRRSVIITTKVVPLLSKKTGQPWCYKFDCKSIGTGTTVRCSVRPGTYKAWPFKKGDTLRIRQHGMTMDKGGYWWITDYTYLFDLDDIEERYR